MKRSIFFVLFLLSFVSALLIENSALEDRMLRNDAKGLLERKLKRKQLRQEALLKDPEIISLVREFDVKSKLFDKLRSERVALFAYRNNCLVFWSDNIIQPYHFPLYTHFDTKILQNGNGWYQMVSIRRGDLDIYCYYTFYRNYPFNNEYFVNAFSRDLGLADVAMSPQVNAPGTEMGGYKLHAQAPSVDHASFAVKRIRQILEFCYVFSFFFFAVFAFYYSGKSKVFHARLFVVLLAFYLAVFNLLAFFNVILKHKEFIPLFSPDIAAYSDTIPSLGHCILLSVAILAILVIVHQSLNHRKSPYLKDPGLLPSVLASLIHWALNALVVLFVIPTYLLNSRISYDFKSLTNVSEYTLVGMFTIFLLFLFILLINRILATWFHPRLNRKMFLMVHLGLAVLLFVWAYFIRNENGFLLLCFSVYGMLLPLWVLFVKKVLFRHIMATALLTAAIFSVQFEQINSYKEKENRKLFASKLIAKEDIDLEIKLLSTEEDMIQDAAIDSYFYYRGNDYQELELNYRFNYFNDFLKSYDIVLMRYDSLGQDLSQNKLPYDYVNALYNQSTNKSITHYFLYIKDLHYLGGYLAKYEICPGRQNLGYVFLMLTPKVKSDHYNLDYFFSKTDESLMAENRYSYAIYQKGELIRGLGSYPYTLNDHRRYSQLEDETFLEQNGYSQLLKKIDDETLIIVSLKLPTWNQIFSVFTFTLLYFSGILVLVFILIYVLLFLISLFKFNSFFLKLYGVMSRYLRVINVSKLYLETKIRISFLLMAVLICSVVVYFTVQNVNKSFRENQNETLDKKMSQIVSELELGFRKRDERPLQNLIKQLANTHEVDINLYLSDGTLYQAANHRIFSQAWFSPYMHPLAHFELIQRRHYSLKQIEKIGRLEYQSYYNALFDEDRNLAGYVHLPYFSKSLDLKTEFSAYLGSLLNMSTLLLMISLLIASYIGRNLVRPLNVMIDNLARIRLGAQNKSIIWNRNDEIGQLADQYNRMLKELESSTEKLARSEREGAWKEMAKQVAHEIKNPLTPMKLHLQHLQMLISRNDEHLKEKVSDISRILIEQIDQLSRMAEEFSSFAKMPMAVPQEYSLHQVLDSGILLFRSQNELEIDYRAPEQDWHVFIDKDQMLRVFTNILKNALQAAREDQACRIRIRVKKEGQKLIISFSDNGKGIPDELKEKIFQPNFSTKNSGMGLGLAICRKIIEQVSGQITFESELGKGSTFYVTLPVYNSDH